MEFLIFSPNILYFILLMLGYLLSPACVCVCLLVFSAKSVLSVSFSRSCVFVTSLIQVLRSLAESRLCLSSQIVLYQVVWSIVESLYAYRHIVIWARSFDLLLSLSCVHRPCWVSLVFIVNVFLRQVVWSLVQSLLCLSSLLSEVVWPLLESLQCLLSLWFWAR